MYRLEKQKVHGKTVNGNINEVATSIPPCWIHFVFVSEQISNSICSSIYLSLHYISRFIENICSTTKFSSYIFHITGSVATYENGMYIPLNGTVCELSLLH